MHQTHYQNKAIPLVSVDVKTGKYTLTQEADTFLKSIPGPIGIVSVAGLYRTGKSYLLNRMLLNQSSGFGVGNTVNACTKGLWCWGTPIKGTSTDGQSVNIIVVDTEGIGALDEDQTHDTRIFTLAILASSCFIYNSVGSIDETAVQNLSLVVNLTKHIQVRTNNKKVEQDDPDEMATYFPDFYWVVRDFSLQLVDPDGNQLTSKQYLQRALAPQKGISDDIQQKNRIRHLLTTFFKQRDCFTLIRPLVDETKLQDLDKLDFDELRPEFVDQIFNFRKRVLNRIKVKTMNDQKLNGQMYLSMLSSYVVAINEGAVPNIQNAWNYMCRQQCNKVIDQSYQAFLKQLKDRFSNKFPCSEQQFSHAFESAIQFSEQIFKKKSIGENVEEYWRQLKKKMKSKMDCDRATNEKESRVVVRDYFAKNFSFIEKKLRSGEFTSFSEFQKEMENQLTGFMDNGPKVANGKATYLELMKKVTGQGTEFIIKRLNNQHEKERVISKQKLNRVESQVQMLKQQITKSQNNNSQKIATLDKEKIQLQLKLENMTEQLQRTVQEKLDQEKKLGKNLSTKQSELEKVRKNLETKNEELTKKCEGIEKDSLTKEKEWEKEKAIFELKMKQQTIMVEQLQKKEKSLDSTLNFSKNQMNMQMKEAAAKYEKKIGELTIHLNQYKEQANELTEQLSSLKQQFENKTEKYEKKEKKYKEDLSLRNKQLEKLKHEYELDKNRLENQYEINKEGTERQARELHENYKKQQVTIKSLNEQLKSQKIKYENQMAIINQKLEFCQEQLRQSKQQNTQTKQFYENTIRNLQNTNGQLQQQAQNKQINDIKNNYLRQMKTMETDFQASKKKMEFQMENLRKNNHQLELKNTLLEDKRKNELQETEEHTLKLQEQIETLNNEIKNIERLKTTVLIEKDAFYENKIRQMENEMEQIKQRAESENKNNNSKSQNCITQLKNYYEMQMSSLENKIASQRQKFDKKYSQLRQQYERRNKEDIQPLQQELQQLREENISMETTLKGTINNLQHECDLKSKQIQNCDKIIIELKDTLFKKETELSQKYDNLVQSTRTEKQVQFQKIENLQTENNKKDKQVLSLTHLRDQLANSLEKKESKINELQAQVSNLKSNYESQNEEIKKKYNELAHETLEKKINYEKTIALITQEGEFNSKKVLDLEKQIEILTQNHEAKIKSIKEEANYEINTKLEKITNQKSILEQKYEKIKKSSRETETNLQKQISQLSKEKAVDHEKLVYLEEKAQDLQMKKNSQTKLLQADLLKLRESSQTERKTLVEELNQLKAQHTTLENQRSQLAAKYDKDTHLLQNKVKHLEDSKQQLKKEFQELKKKFETTVDNHQKTRMSEKTSAQNSLHEQVSKIENRYRTQISQLSESLSKKTHQLDGVTKHYDMELRMLTEKLALQTQGKQTLQQTTDKKLTEMMNNEKKLSEQIDRLKLEKEMKGMQYQKQFEAEKDTLKNKIKDTQERYKDMQKQRQDLFFSIQKEKTKWRFQRENFDQKVIELKERIKHYEQEVSKLQRNNQKLKAQKKNATKTHSFYSKFNATTYAENNRPYNREEQENKENVKQNLS